MKILITAAIVAAGAATAIFLWPFSPEPIAVVETGAFPGKPAAGTAYWGSSVTNNGDPAVFEAATGEVLSVRRTFYQWRQRSVPMVDTAAADVAAGRLPWLSVKTPSWVSMADGSHDAEIDEMLVGRDALEGPVWLTLHHEPEGGGEDGSNPDDPGGPAAHLAMNRRVRERMRALGTDNISLAPILMSWTFRSESGRIPDDWWEPGIYDFLGIDHYQREESTLVNGAWRTVRRWAAENEVDVAVAEWGLAGSDEKAGERIREWFEEAASSDGDGKGARVLALTAYDTGAGGGRRLAGDALRVFEEIMSDPRVAHIE
jgi:hypothetical protein